MSHAAGRRIVLAGLLVMGIGVFFTGIEWGLPSRDADAFLFGSRPAWTGRQIMDLAGERAESTERGADVPTHRLDRTQVLWINQTDAQRAEIVRRYRLYTEHPDEMLIPMALRRMGPGKGYDPRMYQYGGLFLYPIGGIIRIAGALGCVHLAPGVEYYLDHPDAFGRFYILARAYVALWGLLGIVVVFHIARRLGAGTASATVAALGYLLMPVVVNMAHEAKPHLPGAVLTLAACLAASRYADGGKRRWALAAGGLCGAAAGMVLTGVWSFALLPLMVWLRGGSGRDPSGRDASRRERVKALLAAVAIGAMVYSASNPYVIINLVRNPGVVRSNLGNTSDMFHAGRWRTGLGNALWLLTEGASLPAACVGGAAVCIAIATGMARWRRAVTGRMLVLRWGDSTCNMALLLAAPAFLMLVLYFTFAAGKSGEYGRFAVLPDIALMLAAVAGAARWCRPVPRAVAMGVLLLGSAIGGATYLTGFVRDCGRHTTRYEAADRIWRLQQMDARSVGLWAEPAPYSAPPVDLFDLKLVLLPPDYALQAHPAPADVLVKAVDVDHPLLPANDPVYAWWPSERRLLPPARISWADKPFAIIVRR